MLRVRQAVLSVSNKEGLKPYAQALDGLGVRLLATEGTAAYLEVAGVRVERLAEVLGQEEILGGRVKTLGTKLAAALLADRTKPDHMSSLRALGMEPIDMVVVNLYPFQETIEPPDVTLETALENVDIGGVTLLRAAAKNWRHVAAVVRPGRYEPLVREMKERGGEIGEETLQRLALDAFDVTSGYDSAVYNFLWSRFRPGEPLPDALRLAYPRARELRYGENPYQKGAFYGASAPGRPSMADVDLLHGKELSYNNLLDIDAVASLLAEFDEPAAAVVKHTNPSGVALGGSGSEAFRRAHDADPKSAYGGVVGFNVPLDAEAAAEVKRHFIEVVVAPDIGEDAADVLRAKKNLRLVRGRTLFERSRGLPIYYVEGGLLVQTPAAPTLRREDLRVVTRAQPTEAHIRDMLFGFRILGHARSNAIVLAKEKGTVGIGTGQMSRVDSVFLACWKAGERARGSVLCSDAFFPFRDGIDEAGKAGVAAVLQPGGSIRDEEVIAAADGHGMAMVFCGTRRFKH